ncbi:MAG: Hypothetical protein BHV28_08350 [Candidatus Tokpelaia hoelldobleri]|uniref:IrrE N-terminal-like domain-containing protein n=1 Tax=Candidatus Tokpelaia hoelldobleri TaxID=1902579 RepID=A0A1U9JUI3_9HYPH|nr:MAG: Hypothetical protein BHV28_08350 [Candidatus Tokpelaia hoelldoblerii]
MLLRDQEAVIEKRTRSIPVKVVALARDLGLKVYTSDALGDQISGLIRKDEKKGGSSGYAIFINANHSEERRRFTIAHEIAHFVLHKSLIGDGIMEDALFRADGFTNELEREANAFASDILMPKELIKEAHKEGIMAIPDLARKFKVSRDAMSYRLYGLPFEEKISTGWA